MSTPNSSKKEKKVYVSLLPRKPSVSFVNTFQSHTFNDHLRPADHPRKGTTAVHYVKDVSHA